MFRWIKLSENQYLGLWAMGLILFVIQEIPYMIKPLFDLKNDPLMNMPESSIGLNICEKVLGSLCMFLMIFIVHKDATFFSISEKYERVFFLLTVAVLALNFAGWLLYLTLNQSIWVIMFFIVSLPPVYYIFIGLQRKNIPLAIAGGAFFIIHFTHVLGNLLKAS